MTKGYRYPHCAEQGCASQILVRADEAMTKCPVHAPEQWGIDPENDPFEVKEEEENDRG